jgi:hypothetical protein
MGRSKNRAKRLAAETEEITSPPPPPPAPAPAPLPDPVEESAATDFGITEEDTF